MWKLVAAFAVSALLASGFALGQPKGAKGGYEQLNLFGEAFDRIRQDAVEPVAETKLIGAAIAGMLSGLDARSAYIDEAAFRAMQSPANDNLAGLGLVVTIDNGQLKVISPQDGSPAATAGIKPGDLIFKIDKEPTYDMTLGEAEQKLRGPAGSEVEITLRRGNDGPIKVIVKREPYSLQTVTARVEAANIGYLRIAGFDGGTAAVVSGAVQDLRQKIGNKLIGFILDLRNNPGGNFDAAVAVADAFIDKGDIVVVKGRKSASLKRISATPGDIAQGRQRGRTHRGDAIDRRVVKHDIGRHAALARDFRAPGTQRGLQRRIAGLAGRCGFVFGFARFTGFVFGFGGFGRFRDFGFEPGAGAEPAGADLLRRGRGGGDQDRAERGQDGGQGEHSYKTATGGTSGHPGGKRHSLPPP